MAKESKTEALRKKLGNVVCEKCGSKKHKTKEHNSKVEDHYEDSPEDRKYDKKEEEEEENGDEK